MTKKSKVTIRDAFDLYRTTLDEADARSVTTALTRFTAPGLPGGKMPKGQRMTLIEMEAALKVLGKAPVSKLEEALDIQAGVMKKAKTTAAAQRLHRHHLKRFVDWATAEGYIGEKPAEEQREPRRLTRPKKQVKRIRQNKKPFALREDEISPALRSELDQFSQFHSMDMPRREATVCMNKRQVLYLLGWLHYVEKVPLDKLSLQSIVPYVKLSCLDEVEEVRTRRECERVADEVSRLLTKFFRWRGTKAGTNKGTASAVINVAKYLYRDDVSRRRGYEFIPVVAEVRAINRQLSVKEKEEPRTMKKAVDWETVLEVLEVLKANADQTCNEWYEGSRFCTRARPVTAIACSLQNFLLLGFFCAIPVQRQRVLREMQIGINLIRGAIQADGLFVAETELEAPSQAGWVLYLPPDIQKEGKIYGEMWLPVDNIQFPDGTAFYQYIDRWLKGERALFNPNHNYFFTKTDGSAMGKPMTENAVYYRIRDAFLSITGVAVNPHMLRNIFITHISRMGLSDDQKLAIATAQGHSSAMQQSYNLQTKEEKMAPAFKVLRDVNSSLLSRETPRRRA